jgi:hypothetical protein
LGSRSRKRKPKKIRVYIVLALEVSEGGGQEGEEGKKRRKEEERVGTRRKDEEGEESFGGSRSMPVFFPGKIQELIFLRPDHIRGRRMGMRSDRG